MQYIIREQYKCINIYDIIETEILTRTNSVVSLRGTVLSGFLMIFCYFNSCHKYLHTYFYKL